MVGAADRLEQKVGPRLMDDIMESLGVGEPRDGGSLRRNISLPILWIGASSPGGDDALRLVPLDLPNESSSFNLFIPDVSSMGKSVSSAVLPCVEAMSSVTDPLLVLRDLNGDPESPISLGDR